MEERLKPVATSNTKKSLTFKLGASQNSNTIVPVAWLTSEFYSL
jgi:hypothetical protein